MKITVRFETPETELKSTEAFLRHYGKYIFKLQVKGPTLPVSAASACALLVQILTFCPYLKRLEMSSIYINTHSRSDRLVRDLCILQTTIPEANNIAHLSIRGDNFLQTQLLKKYSRQLETLHLKFWHNHSDLSFERLDVLTLDCPTSPLEQLKLLKAPNLTELSILENREVINISTLVECLKQFPRLHMLRIKLGPGSLALSPLEVRRLAAPSQKQICFPSVQILEIRIPDLEAQKLFDFLVFFPEMKNLRICLESWFKALDYQISQQYCSEEVFIKLYGTIRGSLLENKYELYQSNVWSALHKLNTVELLPADSPRIRKFTYTRGGYDYIHSYFRNKIIRMFYFGIMVCFVFMVLSTIFNVYYQMHS